MHVLREHSDIIDKHNSYLLSLSFISVYNCMYMRECSFAFFHKIFEQMIHTFLFFETTWDSVHIYLLKISRVYMCLTPNKANIYFRSIATLLFTPRTYRMHTTHIHNQRIKHIISRISCEYEWKWKLCVNKKFKRDHKHVFQERFVWVRASQILT